MSTLALPGRSGSLRRPLSRLLFPVLLALGSTGVTHALVQAGSAATGPGEKELLADFGKAFSDPDPAKRATAVTTLGDGTRTLPDKGVSKAVARALVKALQDPDLDVCAAAVAELAYGRDPDMAIEGLSELLKTTREQLERRLTGTDLDSRNYVSRGAVLFRNGCFALATYRDDRAAAVLVPLLGGLHAITEKNDLAARLMEGLAGSTLMLGTLDGVEGAVKLTKVFTGPKQEPAAKKLHEALAEYAKRTGSLPPEWSSEHFADIWQAWFAENGTKLPKKLGHLKAPPMEGPSRAMDGLPGKSA